MNEEFFEKFERIWKALWNWIYTVLDSFYPDDNVMEPDAE